MRRIWKAIAAAALLLPGVVRAAEPGASDWSDNEAGRVRLVSATTTSGDAALLRLGLHFELKSGWKIYWRTPGDAGYPPKIDWSASENLGDPRILWPAPKRFVLAGLQNHGYSGEVILPLDVPVPSPGAAVRAKARLDYLACAQICVPMQAALELGLPAGPTTPSTFAHDIGRFAALVPGDGARHGLAVAGIEAEGDGALRVTVTASEPFDHPDLFVEPPEVANFDQPRVTLSDGGRRAVIQAPVVAGTLQRALADGAVTVTVVDGNRSLEASAVPAPATAATSAQPSAGLAGLAAMMAVALLGGLILNLMPCVLPVLSIKVVGVIGHGGGERAHVRGAFLASAAGIVASFLALAATATTLKSAGAAVGWGIQFQQPGFLSFMATLVALFAANLWGLFEIPLPSFLMTGGRAHPHHTRFGHFLSGAFATLLATPCSAPFLGTAVGFALARGAVEIFAIFAMLGLGMAAPFLLVAAWPAAAQRLPKPGRWMIVLKKVLAVALVATAAWLLAVLAAQAGSVSAVMVGGALAAAIAMLAVRTRLPEATRSAATVAALALAGFAFVAPFQVGLADGDGQAREHGAGVAWQPLDTAAIPKLVAEGKVVFVDVTADWCITCKVNKATVVERGEVARRLALPTMVPMRGDWTRPDEGISRYLASFGRYGIPFNAVYGPGAPDGIPLSELLTEDEVVTALNTAAANGVAAR
ncbi:MAG: protein-disulfide reductase DsbD family protein [Solirubrobacterales bacterium]